MLCCCCAALCVVCSVVGALLWSVVNGVVGVCCSLSDGRCVIFVGLCRLLFDLGVRFVLLLFVRVCSVLRLVCCMLLANCCCLSRDAFCLMLYAVDGGMLFVGCWLLSVFSSFVVAV